MGVGGISLSLLQPVPVLRKRSLALVPSHPTRSHNLSPGGKEATRACRGGWGGPGPVADWLAGAVAPRPGCRGSSSGGRRDSAAAAAAAAARGRWRPRLRR